MSKAKIIQRHLHVELSDEQQSVIEAAILPFLKFDSANLLQQVTDIKAAILDINVKNSYEEFQKLFHNPSSIIPNNGQRIETHNIHEYMMRCLNEEIKLAAEPTGKSLEELNWNAAEVLKQAEQVEKPTSQKWENLRNRSKTEPSRSLPRPTRTEYTKSLKLILEKSENAPASSTSIQH
jgi:hypothetical protein